MQLARPEKAAASPPKGWQRFAFAVAAIAVGLVPLAVVELVLALFGLGERWMVEDPYIGLAGLHRLFVPAEAGTQYVTSPALERWFEPNWFPKEKPQREFRIFCVGGSTVLGRPYTNATAFSTWLQIALTGMDPEQRFRVVNAGGVSYASYRLLPIVDELLDYEPDLIVLYIGHNEFLEDRTYGEIRGWSVAAKLRGAASRLRSYNLLARALSRRDGEAGSEASNGRKTILGPEVSETLNRVVGLENYQRDAQWQHDVIAHYRHNLREMVQRSRSAGVPVIVVNPACNFSDCRPFKSQHREGLSPGEQESCEQLIAQARTLFESASEKALDLLVEAEAIDDLYAELFYWKGKCLEALGRTEAAREAYVKAKDLDVCPLRVLEPMRAVVVEEVARQTDARLLDAHELFEEAAGPLYGRAMFLDHVHPTIAGHQLLARALADEMVRLRMVHCSDAWRPEQRDASYQEYLDTLDESYFVHGRLGLSQVLAWAHRYDEAEEHLRAALAAQPRNPQAYAQLGQILARQGRLEAAAAAWNKALSIEASSAGELLSMALYEAESESYDAAHLALKTFLAHDPPLLMEAEAYFAQSVVHLLEDDRPAARQAFARIKLTAEQIEIATRNAPSLSWWSRYRSYVPKLRSL